MEYHHGRIWLDPDHTEGTRLHFTLTDDSRPEQDAETAPVEESTP